MIWDCSAPLARIATLPFMSIVAGLFSSSFPGRRSRASCRKRASSGSSWTRVVTASAAGMASSTSGKRASFWISFQIVQGPIRRTTWVSVLPIWIGLIVGEGLAGEDRRTLDEQIAVPGEAEPGPDKELVAVGGDDLVHRATELHAVQGVPGRCQPCRLRRPRPAPSASPQDA